MTINSISQQSKSCEWLEETNGRDCSDLYDCCDCGGYGCDCSGCFSCNACEHCLSERN